MSLLTSSSVNLLLSNRSRDSCDVRTIRRAYVTGGAVKTNRGDTLWPRPLQSGIVSMLTEAEVCYRCW